MFEGYVGIRLWDGQLVDDVVFALVVSLLVAFAFIFRANFLHFVKMLKDVVYLKERQNLFDDTAGKSGVFFRNFMLFQALFLCSIALFAIARTNGAISHLGENAALFSIAFIFLILFLFFQFKQLCYYLLGFVFAAPDKYKFWKKNYNAIMGVWGILLYIPVVWLMFVGNITLAPVIMFCIFYFLCRFVIIYKTIRIFHKNNVGLLYISLYLCTQEILPLIFLYEGMIFLYNFIETSTLWH